MPSLDVNIAIIQNGQVLLARREDFEVWCLPGGEVEAGESLPRAAVRKAREETGLQVELTRLVGIYSRPQGDAFTGHIALFAARPVGGDLDFRPEELSDLCYFDPSKLPADLVAWHRRRILDAMSGAGGSLAWVHDRLWLLEQGMIRQDLYALRDRSGLSRPDFYAANLGQPGRVGEMDGIAHSLDPVIQLGAIGLQPPAAVGFSEPELGVNVAIIQDGKILLTQREDYEVWCMPGGAVENGETLVQASIRETYEEAGLEVKLARLVGMYSDPHWFNRGLHVAVFAGQVTGRELRLQHGEVLSARFFAPDELPEDLLFGTQLRIQHALEGVGGSLVWTQYSPQPLLPPLTRQEIFAMRDRSGLPRVEFYRRNFGNFDPGSEILEVGPHVAEKH